MLVPTGFTPTGLPNPSLGITGQAIPTRLSSIDIFRGLTMMLMIFVNDLASVKGLPWWTYHMPRRANGMTYVDMVFPAFLFIVGMSIPLAIRSRLNKDESNESALVACGFAYRQLGCTWAHSGECRKGQSGPHGHSDKLVGFYGARWSVPVLERVSSLARFSTDGARSEIARARRVDRDVRDISKNHC